MSAPAKNHVSNDAYLLMRYATADGSVTELIWNSRDGITPFAISTRDGLREMSHVDWRSDRYLPFHVPEVGDRIFVSMTEDYARPKVEAYVEKYWDSVEFPMSERWPTKEIAVAFFVRSWVDDWGGESPTVVEVTAEMQTIFAQRAREAQR